MGQNGGFGGGEGGGTVGRVKVRLAAWRQCLLLASSFVDIVPSE